jgi:hypothetical protein
MYFYTLALQLRDCKGCPPLNSNSLAKRKKSSDSPRNILLFKFARKCNREVIKKLRILF